MAATATDTAAARRQILDGAIPPPRVRGGLPEDCVHILTTAIQSGALPKGMQLPSEADLATQLGVSRPTLREALRILADRRLVVRRHGSGTFVRDGEIEKDLHRNFGITAMIRAAGFTPSTGYMQIATDTRSPVIEETLGLESDATLLRLDRVRLADGRPVVFTEDYISSRVLDRDHLALLKEDWISLYQLLYESAGLVISHADADLLPIRATTKLAELLEVRRGAPMMCIQQTDFDEAEEPVLYSIEYHVPDWIRFTIQRRGPGRPV